MKTQTVARHVAAALGYISLAIAFAWPLPLHLDTMLPGPVSGDTGVYVWNLWVFRHEILAGRYPFLTPEILSLTPPTPLALHNYTSFANLLAFPLLPLFGTVATFNLLILLTPAGSAYAMFLLARRAVRDDLAAWVAGVAFGFAPFMSARVTEHFSLVQTAPLVVFALLVQVLRKQPTVGVAAALGATVAVCFLCDPYYAVYCVLIAAFSLGYSSVLVCAPQARRGRWPGLVLDVAIVCLAGLVLGILIKGGGRFEWMGIRVSMTRLYTPVLLLTAAVVARAWIWVRRRFTWVIPSFLPPARVVFVAGIVCVAVLSPVLSAMGDSFGERRWLSPPMLWRSSPPGLDLLALFVPNPLHPWFGSLFARGLATMPNGFVENVGSIPWVLIATLVAAYAVARHALPRYWAFFSIAFLLLALGPFIKIGGVLTYVPTPWALLRYMPVVGAARMPGRVLVLAMLGLAMLLAYALKAVRERTRYPRLVGAGVAVLLVLELTPAPRTLHSARVPAVYHQIATDPRPVKVMTLPFGLRDGLSSIGNTTAAKQFFQTVHGKPIVGGYISRLPQRDVDEYRRMRVTRALIDLSEGKELLPERRAAVIARAHELLGVWNLGYVVVNTSRASDELVQFAKEAFDLTYVSEDGPYQLYRTSVR